MERARLLRRVRCNAREAIHQGIRLTAGGVAFIPQGIGPFRSPNVEGQVSEDLDAGLIRNNLRAMNPALDKHAALRPGHGIVG